MMKKPNNSKDQEPVRVTNWHRSAASLLAQQHPRTNQLAQVKMGKKSVSVFSLTGTVSTLREQRDSDC